MDEAVSKFWAVAVVHKYGRLSVPQCLPEAANSCRNDRLLERHAREERGALRDFLVRIHQDVCRGVVGDQALLRLVLEMGPNRALDAVAGKCLQAGASDYVAKPVNTSQLLSLVRMWLQP